MFYDIYLHILYHDTQARSNTTSTSYHTQPTWPLSPRTSETVHNNRVELVSVVSTTALLELQARAGAVEIRQAIADDVWKFLNSDSYFEEEADD